VPESRRRRRRDPAVPPPAQVAKVPGGSGRWVPITGSVLSIVGVLWIVTFYVAGNDIPGMRDLANWNLLIGMGFIVAGFLVFTRWE
jgi:hypothetical protein